MTLRSAKAGPAFFHSASSGGPALDLACDHIAFPVSPQIMDIGWLSRE